MTSNLLPLDKHIDALLYGDAEDVSVSESTDPDEYEELPPWYDERKFKRGQQFIHKNLLSQFSVTLSGLICVFSIQSILNILIETQKSSTMMSSYRRYVSTIKHVFTWYNDELKQGTDSWKSLWVVRKRHLKASKGSQEAGNGFISQRDLVFTQFGFFGLGLLKPKMLGFMGDNEDFDGYLHFWRTIGFMLGIDDKFNLCRPSVDETKAIVQVINDQVYKQLLYDPPEYFYHMSKVMLDGLWYIDSSISTKPTLFHTYSLVGVSGFQYTKKDKENTTVEEVPEKSLFFERINNTRKKNNNEDNTNIMKNTLDPKKFLASFDWMDRITLPMMIYIYETFLYTKLGRMFYNWKILITMFFANYFPYNGIWKFGWRNAFVDMFKSDITVPAKLMTNEEVLDLLYKKN